MDEKKLNKTGAELTDEQANAAAGGYHNPIISQSLKRHTCNQCGRIETDDRMLTSRVNGELRYICFRCAGVR